MKLKSILYFRINKLTNVNKLFPNNIDFERCFSLNSYSYSSTKSLSMCYSWVLFFIIKKNKITINSELILEFIFSSRNILCSLTKYELNIKFNFRYK